MGAVLSLAAAPIGMMGTCCGSLLGSCAASLACKACSCACAVSQRTASILYITLLVVSVLASLSFRYSGGDIVIGGSSNETIERDLIEEMKHAAVDHAVSSGQDWWNQRFGCAPAHPGGWIICCASTCSGDFSVYRFSFTLCLFFASLALLTVGKSRIGAKAHRGFWLIKAFVLMGLLVSTLFIKNETLVGYRETARYLSFGFLVMQVGGRSPWYPRPPPPHTRASPTQPSAPRNRPSRRPCCVHPRPPLRPAPVDHRLRLHHERDLARVRRGLRQRGLLRLEVSPPPPRLGCTRPHPLGSTLAPVAPPSTPQRTRRPRPGWP